MKNLKKFRKEDEEQDGKNVVRKNKSKKKLPRRNHQESEWKKRPVYQYSKDEEE